MSRWNEVQNNLHPAIPFIFLYDDGGYQSFDTSGEFHEWDTIKVISPHFQYSEATDRIYLNTNSSGLFKITFECSYNGNTGGATYTELYKNGSLLEGATVSTYCSGNEQGSESLTYIAYLEKGDYIQIKTTASANSVTSISETSRLIIEFIPMKGWNNSSGGREDYKGGVMR